MMKRVRKGETIVGEEVPLIQKDGNIRWTLQNIVPVYDEDGHIYSAQGVSFDITNLKKTEEELELKNNELMIINTITKSISNSLDIEHMLRTACDDLSQVITIDRANLTLFEVKANTASIGGHLILKQNTNYANILSLYRIGNGFRLRRIDHQPTKSSAAEWIVYSRRPHIERDMALSHFSEDKILLKEGLRSAIRIPLTSEEKIIGTLELFSRKLGSYSPDDNKLLEQIADELAIAIRNAQLFGELKHSHAEVLSTKDFAESIIQNAASGIVTIDPEMRITTFNQTAEEILLWKQEEVRNLPIQKVLPLQHLEDELESQNFFEEVMQKGIALPQKETTVMRKDGVEIPIGISLAPLRGIGGAVALFSDLTTIKAIEEEQQKLKHLAQMGEMSARIAHEIKNSLAALQTGIQMVQATIFNEEDSIQMDELLDEIKRMDRIVKDLLQFSREPKLNLGFISIRDMLISPIYIAQMKLENYEIKFVEEYDENLPAVLIDESKMEQVFINLLLNGVQAMPNGGTLTLRVRKNINFQMGVETVLIEISDTGVGISPEKIERIFDPFFSTKTEGTGLGLSLAKRFVEAHGGTITVRSELGKGTTFAVELMVHKSSELEHIENEEFGDFSLQAQQ